MYSSLILSRLLSRLSIETRISTKKYIEATPICDRLPVMHVWHLFWYTLRAKRIACYVQSEAGSLLENLVITSYLIAKIRIFNAKIHRSRHLAYAMDVEF